MNIDCFIDLIRCFCCFNVLVFFVFKTDIYILCIVKKIYRRCFEIMDFWTNFEKFVGEIPNETKGILTACGYDNIISLSELDIEEISVIENYANQAGKMNSKLQCVLKRSDSEIFSFLPGHKKVLLVLSQKAKEYKNKSKCKQWDLSNATFIMRELINSMSENSNTPANGHRYSEAIQWFATYIYMMCGKAAYEVLCNNLPLPKDSTICKNM